MDMDISMDIHAKSVDMDVDMDGKFHIHGNPENICETDKARDFKFCTLVGSVKY